MKVSTLHIAAVAMFFLSIGCISSLQAQLSFGPLVGYNRTNIVIWSGDEAGQWNPKSSFTVGLSTRVAVTDTWGLQINPQVTGRGFAIEDLLDYRLNLTYLEVPVLLQYNQQFIDQGEGMNIYGLIGPFFNFGLGANAKADFPTSEVTLGGSVEDDYRAFVFGGTAGIGVSFPVASSEAAVQFTASLGLSDADNVDGYSSHFTNVRIVGIYYIR